MMGTGTLNNAVELPDMYDNMPSSTFPSHATLYTGQPPSVHGIVSNSFLDRDTQQVVSFSGNVSTLIGLLKDDPSSPLDVYVSRHGTLYSELSAQAQGFQSLVVGHSLKYGRTRYILPAPDALKNNPPSPLDQIDLTPAYCGIAADKCDRNAFEQAYTEAIGAGEHYDLVTIYTWDTDHTAHRVGISHLDTYLPKVDTWLDGFYQNLASKGLSKNAVFVLFDDHGRINVNSPNKISPQNLTGVFDAKQFNLAPTINLAYPPLFSAMMGNNGAMTEVFLRDPSSNWTSYPQFSVVKELADYMWQENRIIPAENSRFKGQIKYILLYDHNGTGIYPECKVNYCFLSDGGTVFDIDGFFAGNPNDNVSTLAKERLKDLASQNSGSIIIILQSEGNTDGLAGHLDGYYFTDNPYTGSSSVHGSLSRQESNILFYMFYPENASMKTRFQAFLQGRGLSGPLLHKEIRRTIGDMVKHSNELFMQ